VELDELVDHPGDAERYLVYADVLQTRGDRQGEFIAVQAEHAVRPTAALRERQHELLAEFEAELLADLPGGVQLEWELGFVRRVELSADVTELIAERAWLASHRCLRLLRAVEFAASFAPEDLTAALTALLAAPAAPAIERVALGNRTVPVTDAAIAELIDHLPRLRALELGSSRIPAPAGFARLTELRLWTAAAEAERVDQLGVLSELRRLALGFAAAGNPPPPISADGYAALAPILDGERLANLEYLALMGTGLEDRIVDELPRRKILPRLRMLGLDWHRLSATAGEPALARARDALANVELVWPRPAGERAGARSSFRLGVLLRRFLNRPDQALPHYQHACMYGPNVAEHHLALGNTFGQLGRRDDQLAAFDRGLAISPAYAPILFNRGRLLCELGRFAEATASFTRAVDADPRHVNAWEELGSLHRRLGRGEDALACFRTAFAIDPLHHAGRSLFDALLEYGRYAEALAHVDQLRARLPADAQLARKQGRAYLRLGRPADALAIAERADPADHWNQYLMVAALRDLGRIAEAVVICERLAASPNPAHAAVARLQRATLAGTPPTTIVVTGDGDARATLHVLAIAAAALRGEPGDDDRAAMIATLTAAGAGHALERRWDILDVIESIERVIGRDAATFLVTSYAIATGRA
jgi:uncharacterized protein (TIGR02996 family)